jgi:predicted transcriptional regulator
MEMTTKLKLQDDIADTMDKLTEATEKPEENLCEGEYLDKANELKSIYEMIGKLDEAEDR